MVGRGLPEKVITAGFVLALLILGGVGIEFYLTTQKLIESRQSVEHTYQVLEALNNILRSMESAERGRRGYALLKDDRELGTLASGRESTYQAIAQVQQLTSNNPEQQQHLSETMPLIAKRLDSLQQFVELRKRKIGQAAEINNLTQSFILQKKIQTKLQEMEAVERFLLQQRVAAVNSNIQRTAIINGIGYPLSFLLLIGVFLLLQKQIRVRQQAEAELQRVNEKLETRVQERTVALSQANVSLQAEIQERKQAQQELQKAKEELEAKVQERTAELKQLNEELTRSNQELEQFAYITSHDLQEPLRAITGYTQLLIQDYCAQLDDPAQEYTAYIVDGAKRMQQLIQDLLAYSRVGTRDLTLAPADCGVILGQVIKNLQVAIAENNATVTLGPLPTVIADKTQLTQLFQNLIGNGIKFCRGKPPQIHVSAAAQEGEWLFQVQDNGIGIKPRYLDRIFEIFKRLHSRTEFSGTGIGLAICKKIIDRHKGRIWAESEPGTGTTFYFTLPHHP